MTAPTRVVIGEDDVLMREGIARILGEAGYEIVAQAGDAQELLRKALAHHADIAIVDVKMPPDRSDDGLRAAIELRRQRPDAGVLILSQYCEERYAVDLIGDRAEGVGYLLKERVGDVDAFIEAVGRVASGGSALEVVSRMLGRRSRPSPLTALTPREGDVLAAMAQGKSNSGGQTTLLLHGTVAGTALWGAIGVAVGALVRNQVGAIIGLLAWGFVVENLLFGLVPSVGRFGPTHAGDALLGLTTDHLLHATAGGLILVAWAIALSVVGPPLAVRRDAT